MSSLSSGAATLSSTLDVAGDVDVNSGKFAVTASDGSLAISSNKFTVAGNTGNTVVAGTLDVTGSDYVEQPELGSCDAVEHAGCGRRRGRERWWEVCSYCSFEATLEHAVGGTLSVTSNGVFSALLSVGVHSDSSRSCTSTGTSTPPARRHPHLTFATSAMSSPFAALWTSSVCLTPSPSPSKPNPSPRSVSPRRSGGIHRAGVESSLRICVTADADGYLGVAYDRLGVYALAAMKELDDVVETERVARTALEQRVADLEARLARLEAREKGGDARAHA